MEWKIVTIELTIMNLCVTVVYVAYVDLAIPFAHFVADTSYFIASTSTANTWAAEVMIMMMMMS